MRPAFTDMVPFLAMLLCCGCEMAAQQATALSPDVRVPIDDAGDTSVVLRFSPPPGFSRRPVPERGFEDYLRELPLKPHGSPVLLYDGKPKSRQDVHAAVIDMSVGSKDLQQCADAVMRLRSEFLFAGGRQDEIAFHFTSGFKSEWARWRKGERITVRGNTCAWSSWAGPDASHAQFMRYMEMVFTYAGTRSLQRELDPGAKDMNSTEPRIGDVFIQGGSPGHAVIVVDVAHDEDGRIAFLIAQSYMPAQEIHVLKNLRHPELGAWFLFEQDAALYTPEWTFEWSDRRCWPQ